MSRSSSGLLKLAWLVIVCHQLVRAVVVQQWSSRCCVKGATKVDSHPGQANICDSDDLDRRSMPHLHRIICRHAEWICCIKRLDELACEQGIYHAYQGSCPTNNVRGDGKECCSCCRLGILARGSRARSDSLFQSQPCDWVFQRCLAGNTTVNPDVATAQPTTAAPVDSQLKKCSEVSCQHVCQFSPTRGAVCFCRSGYLIQSDGRSCLDVDECAYPNACSPGHTCRNKQGSHECVDPSVSCAAGTERVNGKCQDIDECATGGATCGSHQTCINTDGSYTCRCNQGYQSVPGSTRDCRDIDECSTGRGSCGPLQSCINTPGSFRCHCNRGYQPVRGSTRECTDINECVRYQNQNLCPAGRVCKNDAGSYQCVTPAVACGAGRENKNGRCQDIDECLTGRASCGSQQTCVNTDGSYACRCRPGHEPVPGSSRHCRDIDECSTGGAACGSLQICTNNVGSYTCRCKAGYEPVPGSSRDCRVKSPTTSCGAGRQMRNGRCQDINECFAGAAGCGSSQSCVNTDGSYRCQCRVGFEQVPGSPRDCQDIDECSKSPSLCRNDQECVNRDGYYFCRCPTGYLENSGRCVDKDECRSNVCQHTCQNTDGSYVCSCRSGFRKKDRLCLDIDECQNKPCDHKCYNQYGSYRCGCNSGFTLADDGRTCTDRDECQRKNICMHKCENLPGSYRCTCPSGYRAYLYACQDINECSENPGICTDPLTECYNTYGGHQCPPKLVCPEFFKKSYAYKCQKSCPSERNVRCEAIVDKSYAQYRYNLRSKVQPFVLLTYQIFLSGYVNPPLVRYNFSSGNDDGAFEIRNLADYKAEVWQTHPIVGPRAYRLSFDGEVVENGNVISRYINYLYVYVAGDEF